MTEFSRIYRLFLGSIQDYELQDQFVNTPEIADYKLESWLLKSIPLFYNCVKNLNDIDLNLRVFNVDLDLEETNILSELMILTWYEYQNNNLLVMLSPLNDTDFKFSNHYQDYLASQNAAVRQRERVNNYIINYSLKHHPISEWGGV